MTSFGFLQIFQPLLHYKQNGTSYIAIEGMFQSYSGWFTAMYTCQYNIIYQACVHLSNHMQIHTGVHHT